MSGALTVGSLFSGIGGIDLGLERAGMRVIWQSEIEPYCARVLAKHWPRVPNLGDVTTIDWSTIERPTVLAGGFPCQPVSNAGKRLAQADARWLWPEAARAVRELRPDYVLMENVPGLLARGMGDVLGDLAALRYDAEWESIPAASVGAPHIRDRVFILGYRPPEAAERPGDQRRVLADPASNRERADQDDAHGPAQREDGSDAFRGGDDVADADSARLAVLQEGAAITELAGFRAACRAGWWDVEPAVGRVADGIPARVDRLRALGNAVVPQVAEWIGHKIMAAATA